MRGLHTRSFFWQWQAVYASSNPGQRRDRWQVDGVDWTKERHAGWADQYSFQLEIHRLERRRGDKLEWQLLVVVEHWWGADRRKGIRDTSWCKLVSGRAESVLAWLRQQEAQRAPPGPAAQGWEIA